VVQSPIGARALAVLKILFSDSLEDLVFDSLRGQVGVEGWLAKMSWREVEPISRWELSILGEVPQEWGFS